MQRKSQRGVWVAAQAVRLTDQGPSFRNDVVGATPPTRTIGAHGWHLPCGTCASFTQEMAAVRVFSRKTHPAPWQMWEGIFTVRVMRLTDEGGNGGII